MRSAGADEHGFALVTVIMVLLIALLLGTAGLAETLDSQTLTTRGARVQRAQQATDAGITRILYQQSETNIDNWNLNGGVAGLASVLDCAEPTINSSLQITGLLTVAASSGACPQASQSGNPVTLSQPLGNHVYEQSEFLPGATNLLNGTTIKGTQNGAMEREFFSKIVSLGWDASGANKVYARQLAVLQPLAPLQAVEGNNSVTLGGLSFLGLGVNTLNGSVVSRGNLTLPTVEAGVNTALSNGLFGTLTYAGTLSGGVSVANVNKVSDVSQIVQRQPITITSTKPNCSVASYCTGTVGSQLGTAYNATYDTFSLTSGSVTFPSGDYVFCSFNAASGTTVNVTPTSSAPVRIFIDNPNSTRCAADKAKSPADANLGGFNDVGGFVNGLLGTSGLAGASGFQVYVAGDGGGYDSSTNVQIGPTSTGSLISLSALTYGAVIYAPTSRVTVNVPGLCALTACAGGVFEGAVIGNDTSVTALTITQDLDLGNYPLYDGVNVFRVKQYVQCSPYPTDSSGNTYTALQGNATTDTNGC